MNPLFEPRSTTRTSVSGLVVKSIVAIDGPRVRFAADAFKQIFFLVHISSYLENWTSVKSRKTGLLSAPYCHLEGVVCCLTFTLDLRRITEVAIGRLSVSTNVELVSRRDFGTVSEGARRSRPGPTPGTIQVDPARGASGIEGNGTSLFKGSPADLRCI